MKIKFLGAAGTVTGSSYVLTSGSGQSILIDLGMFLGTPEIDTLNYDPYAYNCADISGVVLTHAHLDHCGRLPILLSNGFSGDIWMTPATRDLTELSLIDSAKIAKNEEKKHVLYDKTLAEQTFTHFKTINYRRPVTLGNFTITFRDAGHILGAASLEIVDNAADSSIRKIVFSGDLGNSPEDLLHETELIDQADAVVMESTYGDRLHPQDIPEDALLQEILAVEASGGTLLIPTFALDRTQELLHMIMHLKKDGKMKVTTPVYLDSPMAVSATVIYQKYPELFNDHIHKDIALGDPFRSPDLSSVANRNDSMVLHTQPGAKVILAGSGMMNGGRILGHAAYYLPMPTTRLFFVGYQGEGTLGRSIMEGSKLVDISGITVPINATVSNTQAMSSHADQGQLITWLGHMKHVKNVFLTHGDDVPRQTLAKKITEELGITNVILPSMNQEVGV